MARSPIERANLPKSVAQRDLLQSFSRMLPELLRFSSASHLLEQIPEALQAHHRVAQSAVTQPEPWQAIIADAFEHGALQSGGMRGR